MQHCLRQGGLCLILTIDELYCPRSHRTKRTVSVLFPYTLNVIPLPTFVPPSLPPSPQVYRSSGVAVATTFIMIFMSTILCRASYRYNRLGYSSQSNSKLQKGQADDFSEEYVLTPPVTRHLGWSTNHQPRFDHPPTTPPPTNHTTTHTTNILHPRSLPQVQAD